MSETSPAASLALSDDVAAQSEVTLVDLLDRLLAGGVVITGDITLALADLDLVHLSLRLVVSSVPKLQPPGPAEAADA